MKYFFYVSILLFVFFCIYVAIVNRNAKYMTIKQKVLKATYPAYSWFLKRFSKEKQMISNKDSIPPVSFYSLKDTLNNGRSFDFEQLKGKKVLLVNTASDCGYTGQYTDLEKLSKQYGDKLFVLGFPSNDFGDQERADDETISVFCQINYGVTFPLMKKSNVSKNETQNEVYQWLTDATKNGWNNKQPSWNFCKYLVDEHGKLTHFFSATVEPMDRGIINAINE